MLAREKRVDVMPRILVDSSMPGMASSATDALTNTVAYCGETHGFARNPIVHTRRVLTTRFVFVQSTTFSSTNACQRSVIVSVRPTPDMKNSLMCLRYAYGAPRHRKVMQKFSMMLKYHE